MSKLALWLLLALATAAASNPADTGGPLRLNNEFPFAAIFMSTPPLDARIPSRRRLDVSLTVANSYAVPGRTISAPAGHAWHTSPTPSTIDLNSLATSAQANPNGTYYVADVETTRLNLLYTQPVGPRGLFEIELPVKMHSSGFLDPIITGWHSLFGFDPADREHSPENVEQVFYSHGGDTTTFTGQRGPGLGDLTTRAMYQVAPVAHGWPALSVSAAVKWPTGCAGNLMGSGGVDVGMAAHLTHEAGFATFYGTAGLNHHSSWKGMESVVVRDSVDLHGGLEIALTRHWSTLAQLSLFGSPIVDTDPKTIGSAASCYALGARYNAGTCQLEAGWIENIVRNNNTHDFGLYAKARLWL